MPVLNQEILINPELSHPCIHMNPLSRNPGSAPKAATKSHPSINSLPASVMADNL